VADIYEALCANRAYHKTLPKDRVLAILRENSGTKLDPASVDILGELAAENEV
jgi:HD-GYP domain-containing protein (c-di-GMP phosphodiesterase class II)